MHLTSVKPYIMGLFAALLLCLAAAPRALAQSQSAPGKDQLLTTIDSFGQRYRPEKLYVQLDKPHYTLGDTLWFKAYVQLAGTLQPSPFSGILYTELTNDSNRVIKRFRLPVMAGITWGSLALNEDELLPGNYTLRMYTNRQRNFSENLMFVRPLYIGGTADNAWLVNVATRREIQSGAGSMHIALSLLQADRKAAGLQDLQVKIKQGRKTLYNERLETNIDGKLNIDLNLPPGAGSSGWVMEAVEKNPHTRHPRTLLVPLRPNNPDIDLQFMPEGGRLLAGLPAHVGFKALAGDGYGVDVKGVIRNSKNEAVTEFSSAFKGMGSTDFTPEAGESYRAELIKADGTVRSYSLPAVQGSGVLLRLRPYSQLKDTLLVIMAATPDLSAQPNQAYELVAHAQGLICWAGHLSFNGKAAAISKISTASFPPGIATFTLFNAARQPVAERRVFIQPARYLQLKTVASKAAYSNRDSIAFTLQVTDEHQQPVQGSFSVAVTDNNQVKADTLGEENIISRLLLTSDLKGTVEQPGYYLDANGGIAHLAELDNLLLTQGWTAYTWPQVFAPEAPLRYAAEPDYAISGRISGFLNKGKAGSKVTLFSKQPFYIRDTVADEAGRFAFTGLPVVDGDNPLTVQARNKSGGTGVSVELNEFVPPVFEPVQGHLLPWYVNTDSSLLVQNHYHRVKRDDNEKLTGNVLKTVTIKGKKVIKNSHNLNGPGESDLAIDEEELLKTPRLSLVDMLYKKIPGFTESLPFRPKGVDFPQFIYHGKLVKFVFDGHTADFFFNGHTWEEYHLFLQGLLMQYTAEDVKGIEMMDKPSHAVNYDVTYVQPPALPPPPDTFTYLEITTRNGKGPFIAISPYIRVYRPLPFQQSAEFYRPKYSVQNTGSKIADLRSTIHWQPNVVTDASGKATISFYAADLPGSYTFLINGTDLNGRLGSKSGQIKIVPGVNPKVPVASR